MNAQLQAAKKLFEQAKAELEDAGFKATLKVEDFVIDLKKLEQERLKSEERSAKEAKRIKEREAEVAKAKVIRDKKSELKDLAEMQAEADKVIAKQDAEQVKQELLEAKELHRYRKEGDLILHRARMQQIRDEAAQAKQAAQFNSIFAPGGRPLGITPGAPASAPASGTFNAPAALRTGAGAAGALGAYPAAGVLYASANAMQVMTAAGIGATTAMVGLGAALSGVGAVFVAYKFIEWGAEFSRQLARMSTLMLSTKASAEEFSLAMDRTAQSAFKISSAFNLDAVDVIKAFKEALSSGIDVADLERFTTTAAQLSTATASTIQETTTLLTSIKDAYGLSVGEVAKQSDLLFNSINVGKIQMKDYVTGFARLADAGNAAGLKIEDLHAAVDGMTRVGMPANRTMTSMVALIHALQNPSEKAKEAMTEMGIAFGDAALRGKSLLDIVANISDATKGGVGSEIGKAFDDERARQAALSLIRSSNLLKNEIVPGLKEVDTAAIASSRAMNNLADNVGKVVQRLDNLATSGSHEAGGWFNKFLFGAPEDRNKPLTEMNDRIAKLKQTAKDAMARGLTSPDELKNTIIAGSDPKLLEFDEKMTNSNSKQRKQMAEIMVAIQQAYEEGRDTAVIAIRDIDKEVQNTVIETDALLTKLTKVPGLSKLSRVDTKEFNARATDDQKQKLIDLESEIEDQKEIIESKKKQLAIDIEAKQIAFAKGKINPIEDQINAAMREGGNKESIPGLTAKLEDAKKEFAKFAETAKEELTNTDVFNPFLAKIFDLTLTIETMRARIATQDTNKERKEKEDADKKAADAAKKQIEEFNTIAERLYKEDVSAYEKAQRDRAAIFRKVESEIERQHKKTSEEITKIDNKILQSKLDARKDDPTAQGRIAREARDTSLDELKRASGGSSKDEFQAALSKYTAAVEAVKNAMEKIDNSRAQRVYQDDQEAAKKSIRKFDDSYTTSETEKAAALSKNDNSVAVRSPQEIAKAASAVQATTKEITKVVLDAQVKLQVDGTLSEKTKLELVTLITDKLKQAGANNNPPPSTYDPSTRRTRSVIEADDNSGE